MSVHYSSAVWKARIADPVAKLVLLKLADNANDAGKCWPSIANVSEETGLCRRTVQSKIRALEKLKLLTSNRSVNRCDYALSMENLAMQRGVQEMQGAGDARCISRPGGVQEMHPRVQEMHLHIENRQRTVKEPSASVVRLPFSSPQFAESWQTWTQHRREIKKPITNQSAILSLKKLAKMTEQQAIDAINHSIANGWQGIFPPKGNTETRPTSEPYKFQTNGHTLRPFD